MVSDAKLKELGLDATDRILDFTISGSQKRFKVNKPGAGLVAASEALQSRVSIELKSKQSLWRPTFSLSSRQALSAVTVSLPLT